MVGFLAAFLLGSLAKYAGIVSLLTSVYGTMQAISIHNRALTTTEIYNNYLAYKTRFNLS